MCAMQAVLFVLLPVVLLVNAQEPTCVNTRTAFQNVGATGQIFSSLTPEAGTICQLDSTCCSLDAEAAFKQRKVASYQAEINSDLSQGLRTCRNHTILGAMSTFIGENKNQLVGDITRVYGLYFRNYLNLFDRFFGNLSSSVQTGDLTEIPTEFNQMFFELYLASFLSNPNAPSTLPNTPEFRSCFYDIFQERNGHNVRDWLRGLERSWNVTMRYFRALKAMERVVDSVQSRQNLTEQCRVSLMRMTDCAHCAGFSNSAQSCKGLCLNTMRGCLLDLGDLVEPMQEFSQALVGLKERVNYFNPFNQITLLQSHVFSFLTSSSGVFFSIISTVNSRCGVRLNGRRRRQADQAPGLTRFTRSGITIPVDALNESAYCLLNNLELFSHMPDTLCQGDGVNTGNDNCWNGRQMGSYSHDVLQFQRSLQHNNPNVLVCNRQPSLYAAEIRFLRYMTREMNSISGVCSDDDEDCLIVPPTTVYYNFDAIVVDEPTTEEVAEGSGSGSEEDSCQPPTATVPVTDPRTTTATAATEPDTTATRAATTATEPDTTATPSHASTTDSTTSARTASPMTSTTDTSTATSKAPVFSTGPTGIVVEPTGSHTVPVPGGTGDLPINTDDIDIGVPGEVAGGGSGSGEGTINGSRGLIPSFLTVCVGLALTVLFLATPTSHSH